MSETTPSTLVIFGCGYVGTALAGEAVARGLRVFALTRNPVRAVDLRNAGVESIVADLTSHSWHDQVPGSVDFAVNCVSAGGNGLEGYRHSYVQGMRSIIQWAQARGAVGSFVYTSSTSVYPQGGGAVIDESMPTEGASDRGIIIRESENLIAESRGAFERWFVLRLAGIYGPARHHLVNQVRLGEVSGLGEHRLNLIHRDDIVRAIWSCLEAPAAVANEIFNVADDAPTPKREVAAWLARRLGAVEPRFTGEPLGTRRAVTPDRIISNGKIRARLGWRPRFPDYRAGYDALLSC